MSTNDPWRKGSVEEGPLPQRITGANLDDLTDAEALAAMDLRDEKIAARVRAEGDQGGVL
ncbi:hypothetical protein APR04_003773 [Promicromonospora umidemergens]|uniref:Uncharacterized protein n=1 Tax=Promicromonospora umidemergens TaxID=629679 RepID=A0ABP8XGX9_9MICO|nr:hypothetical protein [Promicromonospora umidemergens]MCP2284850.1 hypothetical protein [Promicromonospora umidemergens]